jgi:hypothetical protein
MQGRVDLNSEDASIQSACSFWIYRAAVEILALEEKKDRQEALEKVPDLLRSYVKAEALRIWNYRKIQSLVP